MKYNRAKVCGIGWFKKPERELFAVYSQPIYRDRPSVVISLRGSGAERHRSVRSLMSDRGLVMLVKSSFSYGDYVDSLKEELQTKTLTVGRSSNAEMLRMIGYKRADYMFVAEEEADSIIAGSGFSSGVFVRSRFNDMPEGDNRYLVCSRKAGRELVDKLNRYLKQVP